MAGVCSHVVKACDNDLVVYNIAPISSSMWNICEHVAGQRQTLVFPAHQVTDHWLGTVDRSRRVLVLFAKLFKLLQARTRVCTSPKATRALLVQPHIYPHPPCLNLVVA